MVLIQKYKSKPITIEALQWTGDNLRELMAWVGSIEPEDIPGDGPPIPAIMDGAPPRLYVATVDYWEDLILRDWIVRDQLGFHICHAEDFRARYVFDREYEIQDRTPEHAKLKVANIPGGNSQRKHHGRINGVGYTLWEYIDGKWQIVPEDLVRE